MSDGDPTLMEDTMPNPFGNLGNLGGLMKQVKKMQEDMQKAQAELEEARIEATSGG